VFVQAEQPKLLRVSRPAHELGLHPLAVRTWIKQGMIQAVRVGSEARVVQRSEIERLVGRTDRRRSFSMGESAGKGKGAIWTRSSHGSRSGRSMNEWASR
jgi:putative resolvase